MWRIIVAISLLPFALAAPSCFAIDAIVLDIGEISTPQARASNITLTLDLTKPEPAALVQARRVALDEPVGTLREVGFSCADLLVREPHFACRRGRVTAKDSPIGSIAAELAVGYDSAAASLSFQSTGLALAEGRARVSGRLDDRGWSIHALANGLSLAGLRELTARWAPLPETLSLQGRLEADVSASGGNARALRAKVEARAADVNLGNDTGTIVAENAAAVLRATVVRNDDELIVDTRVESAKGQVLLGSVLLDFGANPLQLQARGSLRGDTLELSDVAIEQKQLLDARGQGTVRLGEAPSLKSARVTVNSLEFPSAYHSFMQLALATTDFGALEMGGRASGTLEIADSRITRIDARLDSMNIDDARNRFSMADLRGDLHWIAAQEGAVEPSRLAWNRGSAYGLSGGAAEIHFVARGLGFELLRRTRLPVFDGAIVVHSLSARRIGQPNAELDFDATIEPISMPLLSRAFGWPELSGQLSGSIPGLTYRDGMLSVDGDIVASVFDGTIVGRNFRLRDPLGPWPRMLADVTARNLDLALVTRTFPIGSITGRLDADIRGLELFNWSPVAFDARLYSTPGDRSRRLISQKAVTGISSIGGGGGGVTAALQSGVLRFFDVFRYDRIGLACRLHNDVCYMSGIEPAGTGYYIVKGRGLPRIDVIGNAGRVDWPQLVGQIVAGMRSEGVIVQ